MKKILLIILLILSVFIERANSSEQITFEHYSVENGLSQNTVMAIMQDRRGFMWFGTWDGLNKFDGYEFTKYKSLPGDFNNISTNRIDLIHEDRFGFLWIQTYDGKFHRFNPKNEQFISFSFTSNRYAYGVERQKRFFESSSGEIWIATDELGAFRAVTDSKSNEITITEYSITSSDKLLSNTVNFIFEDNEKNIWLGTNKGLHCVNTVTNQLKILQPNEGTGSNAFYSGLEIYDKLLFGDDNGNVWILKKRENKFERLILTMGSLVTDMKAFDDNHIIFTTNKSGFFTYDIKRKNLINYKKEYNSTIISNRFNSVTIDSYNIAWLESEVDGVFRYRLSDQSIKHFKPRVDAVSRVSVLPNFLVIEDVNKKLWINPQGGGFSLYNREKDELNYFFNEPGSADYRFSNVIHAAYSDKNGNLWLCTYNKGLEKVSFYNPKFNLIKPNTSVNSITSNEVRVIYQLSNKNLIVATKDGSIRFFNPDFKELGLLDSNGTLGKTHPINDLAYCIHEDSYKNIWIGTKGSGLIKLIPKNKDAFHPEFFVERFKYNSLDNYSLSNDNIYSIIEDSQKRILIGTFGGGLNVVDVNQNQTRFLNYRNKLSSYPINSCSKIRHLLEDEKKTLWIATANGLLQIDNFMKPGMKEYYIAKTPNIKCSLSNNDVHFLLQAKNKSIWIGTFGGGLNKLINKANKSKSAEFEIFTTKEGLYSDIILSLQEDASGNLWFTSENSITHFNIKHNSFQNFEIFHGMNDAHFSEAASLFTSRGEMLFGSNKGVSFFKPSEIKQSNYIPPLEFTRFQLFNQDVEIGENSPLNLSIGHTQEIKLTHKQSVFSIEYATLDFANTEKINYAFKLENFENDWNYVQKQRKATYTNLPKGTYFFKVKSTNGEGVWVENGKSIKIIILPSFWETYWARALYIVLFLLILYAVYYITRSFAKLKHDVEIEHKVSDIKLRFFTNISHELRTPLTLITGPVENIMKHEKISESVKDQLVLVQNNAERMLRMINQILDFRKIQNKKMRLQIQPTRIDKLILEVCTNFTKEAVEKQIRFLFTDILSDVILWIDRDKTEIILYNLLSNAFKFTPDKRNIEVKLLRLNDQIQIKVIDQGVGIPKEKKNFLFERFTSANEIKNLSNKQGSGIGLSLVKELIDLHKGNIEVESEPGKGTIFIVSFLLGKEHFGEDVDFVITDEVKEAEIPEIDYTLDLRKSVPELFQESDYRTGKKELPVVLIVEDNDEMRKFLVRILSKNFRTETAIDGFEGMKKALEVIPDMIVTDLMMPVMDGLQLTEKLKNHKDTNHIPVVLLTAKSAIESRLDAMKFGADDYITKPFSPVLLEARIESLIEQRRKLQDTFRKKLMDLEPKTIELASHNEVFIAKLLQFMDNNIENSDLTIDEMVTEMAMGRTVFFNKLKNLTGLAPIEFIRELRIKRAAQLLKTGDYNVSQITYMVGMSDSRYFSKCFRKVYGVTPSEYKKSLQV